MLMVAAVAAGMLMAVAVTASATPIKAANATVMRVGIAVTALMAGTARHSSLTALTLAAVDGCIATL
jgi:hypothetical protein